MANQSTQIVPITLPNGAIMYAEVESVSKNPVVKLTANESYVSKRTKSAQNEDDLLFDAAPLDNEENRYGSEKNVINSNLVPFDKQDISSVSSIIEGIAQTISVTAESSNATEVSVEFGLKLALESGKLTSLFVKGTGEADLKIAFKWTKTDKSTASQPCSKPGG